MNIKKLIKDRGGIKLDIGCGEGKSGDDWIGMDIQILPGVDIIQDFNIHPWSLPDDCVLAIVCKHVLEHIPKVLIENGKTRFPLIEFMNDCWRILKPDGQMAMIMPHGASPGFMQDPTHISQINENTFRYFDPLDSWNYYSFYRPKPWRIKTLDFSPAGFIEVVLVKRREDKSYA